MATTYYQVLRMLKIDGDVYGPKNLHIEKARPLIKADALPEDEVERLQELGVLGEAFEMDEAEATPAKGKGKGKAATPETTEPEATGIEAPQGDAAPTATSTNP